jgi:DNA-binding MarR family transcriptional regulator
MAATIAITKINFADYLHICDIAAMKSTPPDSEGSGASALAEELRIVFGALVRRLREQADVGDLTFAQKSVLLRLERDGPATGSALARAEAMRPQSMGAIIAALETAGYVEGAPDPSDGRQTIISLTNHFREWVSAARAARQDWLLRALQARLTAAEQGQLADAVELLKRLLDVDLNQMRSR